MEDMEAKPRTNPCGPSHRRAVEARSAWTWLEDPDLMCRCSAPKQQLRVDPKSPSGPRAFDRLSSTVREGSSDLCVLRVRKSPFPPW